MKLKYPTNAVEIFLLSLLNSGAYDPRVERAKFILKQYIY
jgi:hypothetical protein